MLFLVMGASGSGKSSSLAGLKLQTPDIDWRDFDDTPQHPTNTAERQQTTGYWLKVAIRNQEMGISTGIAGTIVLGEVLACPAASGIDSAHSLLLDCGDVARIDRIRARDGFDASCATQEMLCWAAWLRMHASDPQWRQDVIQAQGASEMNWKSWSSWRKDDPRWMVTILDNTSLSVEETVNALAAWTDECRLNHANEQSEK